MALFRRAGSDKPFRQQVPIRTGDPHVLYQHGLSCIMRGGGPGAMATGWALWGSVGLHQLEAWDFITDGYTAWEQSPGYDQQLAIEFMNTMLVRLIPLPVAPWPNVYAHPPEEVTPVATVHSAACERVELVPGVRDERMPTGPSSPHASTSFRPARSRSSGGHAAARGLRDPW